MPDWATAPYRDSRSNDRVDRCARGQDRFRPDSPERTRVRGAIHRPSPTSQHTSESDLVDQLFNSSEKRLARLLLLLANFGQETDPEPVIAKISQETLAEMIGTTRSRVNLFMNKFRDLGCIDYNGRITVHSSLLNLLLYDHPQIKR
jgi:hypothetical protein